MSYVNKMFNEDKATTLDNVIEILTKALTIFAQLCGFAGLLAVTILFIWFCFYFMSL